MIVKTVDTDNVPTVPDADKVERWRGYLWRRERGGAAAPELYLWDESATPDEALLRWRPMSTLIDSANTLTAGSTRLTINQVGTLVTLDTDPSQVNLGDLGDANLTGISDGQTPVYDSATGTFLPGNPTSSTTANVVLADNVKMKLGDSSDLEIYHDSSHSYIDDSGSGDLYIRGDNDLYITNLSGSKPKARFTSGGAAYLYNDGSQKLATTSTGIDVTGNIAVSGTVDGVDIQTLNTTAGAALPKAGGVMTGGLDFGDNVAARWGTGNDLSISTNGSNSYINNTGSGDLLIRGNDVKIQGTTSSESMAHFVEDGTVELYFDASVHSSPKLATTATGIDVTGNVVVSGTVDGRDVLADGTKLDGIETAATADQTDTQIKTAYEANSDTNEFSDAEQTKLSGIAAGAEVNVNADWDAVSGDGEIQNKPTTISTAQASEITANTAKVGISTAQTSEIVANTAKNTNATHTGEVTGSGSLTIADDAVTYAKMQNVSATDKLLGRDSAGAGVVEEIAPSAVRTMLNVEDAANNYSHPNHSGDVTSVTDGATTVEKIQGRAVDSTAPTDGDIYKWVNANSQWEPTDIGSVSYTHPHHSGDVTSVNDGATTIVNNVVTLAKMATMATASLLGRTTASTGNVEVLSVSGVRTMLNVADGSTANDTDANLKDRANHTGTQAALTISDFDTEVGNHPDVVANTAKNTNVTTNLSVDRSTGHLHVVSSDGDNAVLPLADTDNWGVMSDEMFDEHTANTAKTGITSAQASAIVANTAKETDVNHNVTTDLSVSRDGTKLDVVSSDGTNAVLPLADTNNWGVMSDEMFDEHEVNNAKVSDVNHNVTTNLSVSRDGTKLDVVSSDGTNAVLPLADTNNWGVMSDEMFDEHEVNNAKVSDVNHNVTTDLSVSRDGSKLDVVSSDGTNAVLPLADTNNWGVMSDEMFDKLDGIEAGATAEVAASLTVAGIVELATTGETTTGTDAVRAVTPAGVQAAIDALVGGAPGALDTLNELAAAIDDDASYASTITTALGLKAPKASPTFTGTVAIPNVANLETAVVANTAKVGISSGQTSAITANTAKVTNVTTDLSVSRDGTKLDVVSSDGTNAVLPLADTDNWGVMSDEMFDEHTANNAKTGISSGQASAITANTAKVTNATHTGEVTGDAALTITDNAVTLAKMAGLVRGKIIVGDNGGNPSALAVGGADQVLTSDGTDVSWEDSAGGVDVSGTPADSQLAVWADADTLEGVSGLTFDSGVLTVGIGVTENGFSVGSSSTNSLTLTKFTSSHAYLVNHATGVTSYLGIRSDDQINLENENGTEKYLGCVANGAVDLYYDNAKKLATTSTGVDITGNIVVSGTVDGRDVLADGTALDAIAVTSSSVTDGTTTFNKYTHPSHDGDDIDIDTTALTGAVVISDLDLNVTTDTSGHVTDAGATIATRTLTLANLGYSGAADANNYTHPTSAGNKHVPAGGSSAQVLTYASDGTAAWADAAGGGHTIQEDGSDVSTARTYLNFAGELVTAADDGSDSTDVTINAKTAWLYG